jgi:hypothetical protein
MGSLVAVLSTEAVGRVALLITGVFETVTVRGRVANAKVGLAAATDTVGLVATVATAGLIATFVTVGFTATVANGGFVVAFGIVM